MPTMPTEAMHWYYRVFKPSVENDQLLQNNPDDWVRLQVLEGNVLKPAMPDGFSGVPNENEINMLYSHVKNNKLFFFHLGDQDPKLLTAEGSLSISNHPKAPEAPQPMQIENPTEQDQIHYNAEVQIYEEAKEAYETSQQLHQSNPALQAAVDSYNASRDQVLDGAELASRIANKNLQEIKHRRDNADRVISQVMATRPNPLPDVFYVNGKHGASATITYAQFDDYLAPNGYDLPENCKLDSDDAATINFAMMGVQSELQQFFQSTGNEGPVTALTSALNGFHYMVTGLIGTARNDQFLPPAMGRVMELGKTAIEAYQKGDASLLGQRLGECVTTIKDVFTGTGQHALDGSLTAATKLTERLLQLFEKKPDIWRATGLSAQHMEFMRGYVQVGKIYDQYLESRIQYNEASFKGTELTQDEKARILVDAVIRRMVENQLRNDALKIEDSDEYEAGLLAAGQKDIDAQEQLDQWIAENQNSFSNKDEFSKAREKQEHLLDCQAHTILYSMQPCDHPIISMLAQPGMLEHLRQNLMQDPAILAHASRSPMGFSSQELETGAKLDTLVEQVQPSVEMSKQNVWFDKLKSMLTKDDPNAWLDPAVASDSNRLMIAQNVGRNGKKLVSVASLLQNGLDSLQNPDNDTIALLYENAKNGNLYFYSKGNDMPSRLGANDLQPSVQQLEAVPLPTLWQRFWHAVTLGWAYAKECNLPDKDPAAFELIIKAREEHAAPVQNEVEVPQQVEQPQPEQAKQIDTQPWKYQVTDTRNMTADDFFFFTTDYLDTLGSITTASALENKDFQPADFYNIVMRQLEAIITKNIMMETFRQQSKHGDDAKEQFLNTQKELYPAMMSGLANYVYNNTDKDLLHAYCQNPQVDSPQYNALINASGELLKTAAGGYIAELNKQNAQSQLEQQQNLPKNEILAENDPPKSQQELNPFAKA